MKSLQVMHVFLNGEAVAPVLPYRAGDAVWVADGGMRHAQAFDYPVDIWWGDFDSSKAEENLAREIKRFPCDKDATDWELILQAIPEESLLSLTGFWGGELDHQWANLWTLAGTAQAAIIAGTQMALFLPAPFSLRLELSVNAQVSIMAMEALSGLESQGLQWPWRNGDLGKHSAWGCRNRSVKNTVEIAARRGKALLFAPREALLRRLETQTGYWEN